MKKLILLSLLFFNSLFGAESGILDINIYTSPFNISGECVPACREMSGNYKGLITHFSPFNGITKCRVIVPGIFEDDSSRFVADTYNPTCVTKTSQKVSEASLTSYGKNFDNNVIFTYKKQDTLSKLFVGTLTLDDDIINIPATVSSNQLVLKSGGNILENETFKSLSNANLGFFINLIYGFQKVYAYVQYFLFIFIGAFFLIVYIWEMAVNKVGKTGEKEKMNKFIIPLVMILLCFIPIPKANGITITPIQSTIQYFMQESNKLADRISIIGSESYVKKLYGMLGTYKIDDEKNLVERVLNLKVGIEAYKIAYAECRATFFPGSMAVTDFIFGKKSFQIEDEEEIKNLEERRMGNKPYSFEGCKIIERDVVQAERELVEKEAALQGIKAAMSGEVSSMLSQLKIDMEKKSNSYGWLYTVFLPANSIVVENLGSISTNVVQSNMKERNLEIDEKYNQNNSNDYINDSQDGGYFGSLAYFMMPGAFGIYQTLMDTDKSFDKGDKLSKTPKEARLLGKLMSKLKIFGIDGFVKATKSFGAVIIVSKIYSTILEYLPLMVGIIAGFIVVGSYFIELFKYFYVAPFIVSYSITRQKQNKIIDFFVDGIGLFLKPMLIVISIYIALVVYYLFTELFMGLTLLNFEFISKIDNSSFNFINSLSIATFTTTFYILTSIATAFMMYQIIVNGAKAFLSLAGLQDKDNLSNSLSQRMDRQTFQV